MKIKSFLKTFLFFVFSIFLLGESIGYACPTDNKGDSKNIMQKVKDTYQTGVTSLQTYMTEFTQQQALTGNASCPKGPKGKKIDSQPWELVEKNLSVLKKTPIIGEKGDANAYRKALQETFFMTKAQKEAAAYEDITKIQEKRKEYAAEIASKNYYIAYNIRKKVFDESKSISEAGNSTGCNESQLPVMYNMNRSAAIKAMATEIALQILIMETEGATDLLKEPIEVLAYTPPEKGDKK